MEEESARGNYKIHVGAKASVMEELIKSFKGIAPAIYLNNVPIVFEVGENCKGCYYLTSFAYSNICYNKETINNVVKEIKKDNEMENIFGKNIFTLEKQTNFLDNKECFKPGYKISLEKIY